MGAIAFIATDVVMVSVGPSQHRSVGIRIHDVHIKERLADYALVARIGEIVPCVGQDVNDHRGWVECDGRYVGVDEYPELFRAIGMAYGQSPPGTFKIPDYRGMWVIQANGYRAGDGGGPAWVPVYLSRGARSGGALVERRIRWFVKAR